MADSDFFTTFGKMVRWVTPLLATIISLTVFVYRSKVKDLEKKIETEKNDRKEADKELLKIFSEETKDEKEWRDGMVGKQEKQA